MNKADGSVDILVSETTLASAATTDLGSATSLKVQITGTATITSFGTAANRLRLVRFAGALTLTHNATSLVLLGGASRTAAAGDVGIYTSDASGNWRERDYCRAASDPGDMATKSGAQTLSGKTLASPAFSGTATGFRSTGIVDGYTGATPPIQIGSGGQLGFSTASSTGVQNMFVDAGLGSFFSLALYDSHSTVQFASQSGLTMATGFSAANAALRLGKDAATSRSVNAAGTINASGADYADYYFKASGCGDIAKGQGVGFDSNGQITDKWANAASFGIKSTAPSYVGGDAWGSPEALGVEEPISPDNPSDDAARAKYKADVAAFNATLETARAKADRIAVAGKVPAIVDGSFTAGDFVIAAQDGTGIKLVAVAVSAITFDQYKMRVGRVLVSAPSSTQFASLVGPGIGINPAWTAIIDVAKG